MENNFDSMLNVSAVPQDDKKAAFIAKSKNNRNRCYELSEQITNEVAADSGKFQQYLDVQARFDRYTANNALLILAQRPDAERLGDYGYWREQGVFVKRAERQNPVLIMEPGKEYEREDGSIGTYYNARELYDISQTTMKERPQPQTEMDERLLIRALINNPPASIVTAEPDQMPEDKGAIFEPEENCIYVRKGMNAQEIFQCLTPELALAGLRTETRSMTGMRTLSMPTVRLICSVKSMGSIHRHMTSVTLRISLRGWSRRKCGRSCRRPVTQQIRSLPVWRKCLSRTA